MYTPNLVSILFYDQLLSIFKFDDVMPTSRMERYSVELLIFIAATAAREKSHKVSHITVFLVFNRRHRSHDYLQLPCWWERTSFCVAACAYYKNGEFMLCVRLHKENWRQSG